MGKYDFSDAEKTELVQLRKEKNASDDLVKIVSSRISFIILYQEVLEWVKNAETVAYPHKNTGV
jgi:hypothetical protein